MLTAHEFLNVTEWATLQQIQGAYLKLVRIYHPDKNGGTRVSTVRFQVLQLAAEAARSGVKDRLFPVWDHVQLEPTDHCARCSWPWENPYVCMSCGYVVSNVGNSGFEFRAIIWRHARLFAVNTGKPMSVAHKIYRETFGKDPVTNGTRFLQE